jgi:DNA-binding transcriptional LysR family regulator
MTAFLAVAQELSFMKAAAELDVTPSALILTIKGLEDRLEIGLLSRTTRMIAPTEAGERLQRQVDPLFETDQYASKHPGAFALMNLEKKCPRFGGN